jgi:hypothetical protein
VVAAAENPDSTHRGPAIDVCLNLVSTTRIILRHLPGGHRGKHYHYEQGNIVEK